MAVIDSKKLLPAGKPGGAIVESQKPFLVPVSNISYKKDINISQKLLKPADKEIQQPGGSLVVIKKKVLKIKDVIGNTYLIEQNENNRKRKEKERQKAEEREKKIEIKPKSKIDLSNLPKVSLPGRSILDTINRFLAFTLAGYLFDKYNKFLPKLLEVAKYLEPVGKFIDIFAKNAVDGIIKFIDLGYKAYDGTRDFVKTFGGEGAAKTFDEFSKNLNLILNGAIAMGMLVASTSPKGGMGSLGAGAAGAAAKSMKAKPISGFGGGTAMTPGRYRLPGQASAGGFALEQARKKATQTSLTKGAATQGAKGAARLGIARVPIIGALISFIIDTVVFREKPSRAAAGAVGNAVGSGIGAALLGSGTFGLGAGVGLFVGGFLGDIVGKSLYDAFTGHQPEPIKAKAQGGKVTSGQSQVPTTRRIRTQRTPTRKTYTPPKTQPGRDVGGKLRIEQLYGKDEPGQRSALRALTKSSADLKGMKSMQGIAGGMFGAGIDMALGQKPDKKLSSSLGNMFGSVIGAAINAELDSSFNDISRSIAMANGGVVPSRNIGSGMSIGERIGRYISNAFSIALESSASRVLQNLNRELNLEGGTPGSFPTGPGGGPDVFHGMGAERMWNFFKNKGLSDIAVAGILGNARWESTFNPTARGKGMGPGGSDAIGIFQWGETARWKDLTNWAKSKNLNPWNYDTQLQFAWYELQNSYKSALDAIQSAASPSEAAEKFRSIYEASAHTEQRRKDAAEGYYQQYKGKMYIPPSAPRGSSTSYRPPTPGRFNAIQYITGDSTQGANYDPYEHGGNRYHEHIAFSTLADKERAKAALRAAGFEIGSEYRPNDPGYHGSGLAIDVPLYRPSGGGVQKGFPDNATGEKQFSAAVRAVLGIGNPTPTPRQSGTNPSSLYNWNQSSLAPVKKQIPNIAMNTSYSQGGSMIIHDVNNIVMPLVPA